MKKLVFIVIFAVCISGLFLFFVNNKNPLPTSNSVPDNIPNPSLSPNKQSVIINAEGVSMRVLWIKVDAQKLEFYSNLEAKQISNVIMSEKHCQALVNGGFYSKENTHLGLTVSNGHVISESFKDLLFNGYLWIVSGNSVISSSPPDFTPQIAIQSGPLLMYNNKPMTLAIRNDEPDRRIIAAITDKKELIFLAVYRDGSELLGPLLEELPKIIDSFTKETKIAIVNAINLDGGSASVFITKSESLPEIARIGSYFCEK